MRNKKILACLLAVNFIFAGSLIPTYSVSYATEEAVKEESLVEYDDENLDDTLNDDVEDIDLNEVVGQDRSVSSTKTSSPDKDLGIQKSELEYAIKDYNNIISTEVFKNLSTPKIQNSYKNAIENGKKVLQNQSNDYEALRLATLNINEAKSKLKKCAQLTLNLKDLNYSIDENEITVEAAKTLLNEFPKLVASVKGDLENQIKKSEKTISESKSIVNDIKSYLNNL